MKKLIVMAMILGFCMVGVGLAEMWTKVLDPSALTNINKDLIDAGHGNLIAQSGTFSAELSDKNSPSYNDLICIDTKTNGMVRVRIIRERATYKITEIKIIK